MVEIDPPRHLRLEAAAWPFGTATVDISLTPKDRGTDLLVVETPSQGPAVRFKNPVTEFAIHLRNILSVRRLSRWAEERHRGTPGHAPEPGP